MENRLDSILAVANAEEWKFIIPYVPLRLRVAIDNLYRSHPYFMGYSGTELEAALREHPAIAAQFSAYNDLTLAFAIRDKRLHANTT